jgi:hypothetical protein
LPQVAPRNIACLESLWHDEIDKPFTVRRILETASAIGDFRVAHFILNPAFAVGSDKSFYD